MSVGKGRADGRDSEARRKGSPRTGERVLVTF